MKKKILIKFWIGLFTLVTMINLNLNIQHNDNISLRNIAALSTANAEDTSVSCDIYYHGPFCGYKMIDNDWGGLSGYVVSIYYSYAYYN